MDFKKKYLKYKKKYIEEKNSLGGKTKVRDRIISIEKKIKKNKKNRNSWFAIKEEDEKLKENNFIINELFKNYFDSNKDPNPNLNEEMLQKLLTKLKDESLFISDIDEQINKLDKELKDENWKKCVHDCLEKIKPFIDIEVNSTAYVLRVLYNSVLLEKKLKIDYQKKLKKFEGVWENDSEKIFINNKKEKQRLIMGFGPSASGKTHMANILVNLLSKDNNEFPSIFLSIDGSIGREKSVFYKYIVDKIQEKKKLLGISNLAKKLFTDPKEKIKKWLLLDINKKKISLYVPETLASCSGHFKCGSLVNDYEKITGDEKWIGLYIWQHKHGKKCDKDEYFKCKGTTDSGKKRELDEGKKFSNKAYWISETSGTHYLVKAPGGRLNIHNSGDKDRISIIIDKKIDKKYLLFNDKEENKNLKIIGNNILVVKDKFEKKHYKEGYNLFLKEKCKDSKNKSLCSYSIKNKNAFS